jgi:hypothetical protein
VLDRVISRESARADYGVVLSPDGAGVDHDATKELREDVRRARGSGETPIFDLGVHGREA